MPQIITHKAVLERTPKDRSTIYRWVRKKRFPVPVVVEGGIGWYLDEIEEWESSRPRVNYKPLEDEGAATLSA